MLLQNLKHHRAASPLHKTDPFLFAIPTHRQACLAFLSSEFGQRQLDQRRCLAPPAQTRLPTPPLGRACARPSWFLLLTRVPLVFCKQRLRRVCRCCCACAGAWCHQCCLPPSRRLMPRLLVWSCLSVAGECGHGRRFHSAIVELDGSAFGFQFQYYNSSGSGSVYFCRAQVVTRQ